MFSILIFSKALKLHFFLKQPWTTNNKNSSNAFPFIRGTYIKNPKYRIIVKKSFNYTHQNQVTYKNFVSFLCHVNHGKLC